MPPRLSRDRSSPNLSRTWTGSSASTPFWVNSWKAICPASSESWFLSNSSYEPAGGKTLAATIFVMPEYLAIGSDSDFLRIPMNLHTAAAIADRFGFVLPTKKIVDAIYDQSACHFTPQPLPAGPQMTSTEYYRMHNEMIDKQSRARGFPLARWFPATRRMSSSPIDWLQRPGRIAIYGWHRGTGDPIQPLSTVHGAGYADYSHGIRLVSEDGDASRAGCGPCTTFCRTPCWPRFSAMKGHPYPPRDARSRRQRVAATASGVLQQRKLR